ncbi:MAG: DNA repair and recombination protein RadB [Candidatus Woesearchaeota archaeon]
MDKLSSNSKVIDKLLEGGFENDVVTTIYGPAASGKTTICLLAAISASRQGKVVFIDCEGGFSVERLKQLAKNYERILEKIFLLKPTTFDEQTKAFELLNKTIQEDAQNKFKLIVVDTISMLYRVKKEDEDIRELNRKLSYQINLLSQIARKKNIPVIITSQVYSDFEDKNSVKLVGGDIIKYSSKCIIELENIGANKKKAILIKHRSLPMREVVFEIVSEGIVEPKKGFKIFE